MPYRVFSVEEVARYLHQSVAAIQRLVKEQRIPFETRGGRVVFVQKDIDAWASQRILGLEADSLAQFCVDSSRDTQECFQHEAIMPELMQPRFIEPRLAAKTKAAVLRAMVALAERTGRVNDPRELLASLEAREALYPTAVPGGLALLHPRHHLPYMFEASFVALGRPLQPVHFSAPDRQPTDLFLLICCQEDRIHLHTLARLCLMALKTDVLARLRAAPDAEAMHACILTAEAEVLPRETAPPR
jgi:excisionase family DNA binding protein